MLFHGSVDVLYGPAWLQRRLGLALVRILSLLLESGELRLEDLFEVLFLLQSIIRVARNCELISAKCLEKVTRGLLLTSTVLLR